MSTSQTTATATATSTANTTTIPASTPQNEIDVPVSPAQAQREYNADMRCLARMEREYIARKAIAPPRKYHRRLYRPIDWSTIPPTDRVTRSMAWCASKRKQRLVVPDNLKGSKHWDSAFESRAKDSRIKMINCRFRIPRTDIIEYWRGGQQMVCPPGVKPWEWKSGSEGKPIIID